MLKLKQPQQLSASPQPVGMPASALLEKYLNRGTIVCQSV